MVLEFFLGVVLTGAFAVPALLVSDRFTRDEAYWLRVSYVLHIVMILVNMAVVKYIYGRGDMYAFFNDSRELAGWLRTEPGLMFELLLQMFGLGGHIRMSGSPGTHTMVGFAAFSRLFFGESFVALSFVPGIMGYFAKVALYGAFRDAFGAAHRRMVMVSFLFVPSAVFWTAGMIKETFGLIAIAMVVAGAMRLTRWQLWALPVFLVGVLLLQQIKGHFLLTLVAGAAAALYVQRASAGGKVRIRPFTLVVVLGAAFVGMLIVGRIAPRFALENIANEAVYLQSKSSGGSKVDIGITKDAGLTTLVLLSPVAVFTGLYRPILLESGSITMIVNSLETTALALLTLRGLRRTGIRRAVGLALRSPVFIFLLVFVLLSSLGIGLATGNLGTLSRYRAPVVPFFVLLVAVLDSPQLVTRLLGEHDPAKLRKKRTRKRLRPRLPNPLPAGHGVAREGRR